MERYLREKKLPLLDKTKFLVPHELTLGQFLSLLRCVDSLSLSKFYDTDLAACVRFCSSKEDESWLVFLSQCEWVLYKQ